MENINGIYCLFKNKKIVYIGQTDNVQRRLDEHNEDKLKLFNRVLALKIGKNTISDNMDGYSIEDVRRNKEMREILEIGLISMYKPKYNSLRIMNSFEEWLRLLPSTTYYKKDKNSYNEYFIRIGKLSKILVEFIHASDEIKIIKLIPPVEINLDNSKTTEMIK